MFNNKKVFAAVTAGVVIVSSVAAYSVNATYKKSQQSKIEQNYEKSRQAFTQTAINKEPEAKSTTTSVAKAESNNAEVMKVASRGTKVTQTTNKSAANSSRTTVSRGGSSNSKALDWWTEASKVFSIGTVAKVTDVYTGKSFNVKRTYGRSHADSEALTSNDSNIIKSIWGGWSWDRRPVIVQVGTTRIAASMTAMPHAGLDEAPALKTVSGRSGGFGSGTNLDAIKGNGMDGHIDIHFLNSKTHGSDKVDPQHQAAIRKAVGR